MGPVLPARQGARRSQLTRRDGQGLRKLSVQAPSLPAIRRVYRICKHRGHHGQAKSGHLTLGRSLQAEEGDLLAIGDAEQPGTGEDVAPLDHEAAELPMKAVGPDQSEIIQHDFVDIADHVVEAEDVRQLATHRRQRAIGIAFAALNEVSNFIERRLARGLAVVAQNGVNAPALPGLGHLAAARCEFPLHFGRKPKISRRSPFPRQGRRASLGDPAAVDRQEPFGIGLGELQRIEPAEIRGRKDLAVFQVGKLLQMTGTGRIGGIGIIALGIQQVEEKQFVLGLRDLVLGKIVDAGAQPLVIGLRIAFEFGKPAAQVGNEGPVDQGAALLPSFGLVTLVESEIAIAQVCLGVLQQIGGGNCDLAEDHLAATWQGQGELFRQRLAIGFGSALNFREVSLTLLDQRTLFRAIVGRIIHPAPILARRSKTRQ